MNRPKPIYKYARITDDLIDSLQKSYLWFSSNDFLNDPFDLNYRYSEKFMSEILGQSVNQVKNDLNEKFEIGKKKISQESIDKLINGLLKNENYIEQTMEFLRTRIQYSICCFTEKFDNTLMWSHYAENHKGICLIYDLERDSKYWDKLFPVQYQKKYPIIESVDDLPQKALLRKSPDWYYEQEWRILSMNSGKNPINNDVLIGVIFGCNIPKQNREKLILVCENLGIKTLKYYQMEKHKKEYKLIRNRLFVTDANRNGSEEI